MLDKFLDSNRFKIHFPCIPTGPFPILEPEDQEISEFYVV